jgi:S-(hydroxymethyl)glutathione dehydrogenase / alcohol dehydrogenase
MTSALRFQGRIVRAAVCREVNQPLEIEELEIAEPGPGEVMVRLGASGVCHSDLHVLNGEWSEVRPIVLGHEGAGTVVALGTGVNQLAIGDPVVLSWLPSCGRCRHCHAGRPQLCLAAPDTVFSHLLPDGTSRLRSGDEQIRSMLTVGSFGEYTVVPERGAIPIDASVPADRAAVVGCAVTTGVGAAVNTARVFPGESVAVIGCGGVGISIIQGCAAQAADPLIAVDTHADKLAAAARLGATHTVDASAREPVAAVRDICPDGVDYAFEAIGLQSTIEHALSMLGNGGATVLVGMPPDGVSVKLDPNRVAGFEHRVLGCNYGSSNPAVDFPRILRLYQSGRLDLDAMITRRIGLEQINDAFAEMARGEGIRTVIIYD